LVALNRLDAEPNDLPGLQTRRKVSRNPATGDFEPAWVRNHPRLQTLTNANARAKCPAISDDTARISALTRGSADTRLNGPMGERIKRHASIPLG
jgi:hypothetical protein